MWLYVVIRGYTWLYVVMRGYMWLYMVIRALQKMPSRNNPRSRVVRLSPKMARGDACRLSTRALCCLSMRQAVILTHVRVASACYKRLYQPSYFSRCAVFKFNIKWVHEITRNYNKVM